MARELNLLITRILCIVGIISEISFDFVVDHQPNMLYDLTT